MFKKKEELTIALYDLQGHMVRLLFRDSPPVGEHVLRFNKDALNPGAYMLTIATTTQTLAVEKMIITE